MGETTDYLGLEHRLEQIAGPLEYVPRQLKMDEQPTFRQNPEFGNSPVLEDACLLQKKRGVYFGDSHGLIVPMLNLAVKKNLTGLPVSGILNADFHVDAYPGNGASNYYRTWQRIGVEIGFWTPLESYSLQPPDHHSQPPKDYSKYTRLITSSDELRELSITVFSLDLDFFNRIGFDINIFRRTLDIFRDKMRKSSLVMIFSSSPFNYNATDGKPYHSDYEMKSVVTELLKSFKEGD